MSASNPSLEKWIARVRKHYSKEANSSKVEERIQSILQKRAKVMRVIQWDRYNADILDKPLPDEQMHPSKISKSKNNQMKRPGKTPTAHTAQRQQMRQARTPPPPPASPNKKKKTADSQPTFKKLGATPSKNPRVTAKSVVQKPKSQPPFATVKRKASAHTPDPACPFGTGEHDRGLLQPAAASSHRTKGTSQALEKSYLRLTGFPDWSTIRPPKVLPKALKHVTEQYEEGAKSYHWVSDQLRAIRQDATVQDKICPIELTAQIYEAHVSCAASTSPPDLAELSRCIAQLTSIYESGFTSPRAGEMLLIAVLLKVHSGVLDEAGAIIRGASRDNLSRESQTYLAHAMKLHRLALVGRTHQMIEMLRSPDLPGAGLVSAMISSLSTLVARQHAQAFKPAVDVGFLAQCVCADEALKRDLVRQLGVQISGVDLVSRVGQVSWGGQLG
ncbi:SAC3/GANP/Nin1/mts3/eIF-3 p25 [Carpediemonas membranifera]|uniref:SAC3/GANP/Nin1/mts3/eIF-3 p25 n=1 Tax=Carpediemonas membranifera TaxID=201153 RepID=A0A8J6E9G5_9EUKA|nr:SAC3/GANP/Nin1/mts3/eIF-3 p25 [Carpediemonas membranifera]|eukprot:KAG9393310.1 SAC3/GANP/Nin1/mts3/eIF-3 p25 [Carpediemonas membranifera]